MTDPFLGSEALAVGAVTPYELRSRYISLHKDVYVPRDAELTAVLRAKACWLRSRRRGVLAGFSASALHGSKWIDPTLPAAIIDTNRRPTPGVQAWDERIEADEIAGRQRPASDHAGSNSAGPRASVRHRHRRRRHRRARASSRIEAG